MDWEESNPKLVKCRYLRWKCDCLQFFTIYSTIRYYVNLNFKNKLMKTRDKLINEMEIGLQFTNVNNPSFYEIYVYHA